MHLVAYTWKLSDILSFQGLFNGQPLSQVSWPPQLEDTEDGDWQTRDRVTNKLYPLYRLLISAQRSLSDMVPLRVSQPTKPVSRLLVWKERCRYRHDHRSQPQSAIWCMRRDFVISCPHRPVQSIQAESLGFNHESLFCLFANLKEYINLKIKSHTDYISVIENLPFWTSFLFDHTWYFWFSAHMEAVFLDLTLFFQTFLQIIHFSWKMWAKCSRQNWDTL